MSAIEIVAPILFKWGGKEVLDPTGAKGNTYPSLGDWMVQKQRAGIAVYDVTNSVIVRGVSHWAAFEEVHSAAGIIRTIFEIT
jgi:hypothetical protein